jgi:hypothetical protein
MSLLTADDVRFALRAAVAKAGNIRIWAEAHHCCKTLVSQVLSGKREPGFYICRALGVRKVVNYEIVADGVTEDDFRIED